MSLGGHHITHRELKAGPKERALSPLLIVAQDSFSVSLLVLPRAFSNISRKFYSIAVTYIDVCALRQHCSQLLGSSLFLDVCKYTYACMCVCVWFAVLASFSFLHRPAASHNSTRFFFHVSCFAAVPRVHSSFNAMTTEFFPPPRRSSR